jgi:uncharacterized protein
MSTMFGQNDGVGDPIYFEADPDLPVMPAIARGRTNCGDIDMRIAVDGTWFHEGTPIGRKELVKLFSKVLTRDKAGRFWLVTPAEMARIQVEDAPFIAVEMTVCGSGRDQILTFRTNIDETVVADKDHPIRFEINPDTGEPSPYVAVRKRMDARVARSVYYDLVSLGTEEKQNNESVFGIWSSGIFFPIGSLDEDDAEEDAGL